MSEPTSELEWLRGYRRLLEDSIQAGEVELFKLRKENAELREENAKLRSCLSDDADNSQQIMGENAWLLTQLEDVIESMGRVEEQCAKLRRLVRDYDYCVMHSDCSRCKYDGKPSTHCPLSPCFPDTGELYKLGVEVDER